MMDMRTTPFATGCVKIQTIIFIRHIGLVSDLRNKKSSGILSNSVRWGSEVPLKQYRRNVHVNPGTTHDRISMG